jgi:hypothetical protein
MSRPILNRGITLAVLLLETPWPEKLVTVSVNCFVDNLMQLCRTWRCCGVLLLCSISRQHFRYEGYL